VLSSRMSLTQTFVAARRALRRPRRAEHPTKGARLLRPGCFPVASPEPACCSRLACRRRPARCGGSAVAEIPLSQICNALYLQQILPLQLQLAAFPRSVDYARLKSNLSSFRINTSKVPEVLIMEDLCRT
jgi:hypothetical protein